LNDGFAAFFGMPDFRLYNNHLNARDRPKEARI
jgi:hypothetical protein